MKAAVVLLVDDDALSRALLRDFLKDSGLLLKEARDGEEALAMLQAEHIDLMLLDLIMPRRSGLDLLRSLKELKHPTKVLVVSSLDQQSLVEQALNDGAAGFVTKPFSPLELTTAVQRILEPTP